MSEIPLVSVVMPLYNKRPYVKRATESVRCQTFTDWELIIVDDGSTDGSAGEIPRDDSRLRLLSQENKGPGAARNAGLSQARGKYVSFLDADDEWLPSFLEAGISPLEDKTADNTVVFTGFYYYPGMRRYAVGVGEAFSGAIEITPETDVRLVQQICSHWTCAAIIKAEVVRKRGGFFDRYKCLFGEDGFLFIKLAFNERICIIPEPHAIYHTEASDLYGGGSIGKCFPVPPYLEDPREILNACPTAKLTVLRKMLAQRALQKAETLAKLGRGREAKVLLNRFTGNEYPSARGIFKVRVFAALAPVLPAAGWVWRNTKAIINPKKAQGRTFGRAVEK